MQEEKKIDILKKHYREYYKDSFPADRLDSVVNQALCIKEETDAIMNAMDEYAQHPAGGNVWVKADLDDRTTIPMGGCLDLFIKYDNGEQRVTGGRNLIIELLENGWIDVQWLNEQPVEQKENEAVEIMRWALENIKTWHSDLDRVVFFNGENCHVEQLYNEYQKQNKR